MTETRTYNGHIYSRNAPGEPWQLVGPAQTAPRQQGGWIDDPYKQAADRREDERLRLQQEANARAAAATAAQIENMNRPPTGYQWGAPDAQGNPTLVEISGGPADKGPAPDPDRASQIKTLLSNIGNLRKLAEKSRAVGSWSAYWKDNPLLGQNRQNIEGGIQQLEGDLIQQQIARLSALNAGKGVATLANTEKEAQRIAASIANLSPDQDKENFLIGLKRAEDYYLRQAAGILGTTPDDPNVLREFLPEEDERRQALPAVGDAGQAAPPGGGGPRGPYENDPTGNRTFLTERDKAFAAEAQEAFRSGADRAAMDAIAEKYGAQPFGPDLDSAIESRRAGAANVQFTPTPTGFEEAGLTGSILAPWADGGLGSYAIGAGNAVTAGQLSNIAKWTGSSEGGTDIALGMAQDNVIPYILGELGGGALATLGAGKALGAGSRLAANPSVASLLANPLTADAAYGAAYGASQADDPLYGAIGGATTALAGSYLGGRIGNMIGGWRTPRGGDPLNRGERAIADALARSEPGSVEAALQRASDLGVPASMADVSHNVNTLAGQSIRRSPTAAGMARDVLGRRSQGQIDRFRGAVERDLGPVENIPQRSEDLIAQARAAAGPLYDAAYAAPGATTLDIADLLARPSMGSALSRAGRLAAEEGRDPRALGFAFDGLGNATSIEAPSWQTLDYVKRGLDDVVQSNRNAGAGRLDTEGRAVNDTLQQLLARMDQMNPDYAAARAAYSGPMRERDALQAGVDALRSSPNQLSVDMARAAPSQADQMRLGAQSGLVENAERLRNSSNPFGTLNTPAMEQRLAALYPDAGDDVARLLAHRDLEMQLAGSTNRLVGNSMSAERIAADQAFGEDGLLRPMAEGAIETSITGAPVATVLRSGLGQRVADMFRMGAGRRGVEKADQIAPLVLNTNPEETIAQILALQERDAAYQAARDELRRRGIRPGQVMGTAGVTATYPYVMGD